MDFYLGFTARQDYFVNFEPSQSLGGLPSDHRLHCPPEKKLGP